MKLSQKLMTALMLRSDFQCEVVRDSGKCNNNFGLTAHHIKFVSRGGKNELSNLILCCADCHGLIHRGLKSKHPWISKYKVSRYEN